MRPAQPRHGHAILCAGQRSRDRPDRRRSQGRRRRSARTASCCRSAIAAPMCSICRRSCASTRPRPACRTAASRIMPIITETGLGVLSGATYAGASPRLAGLTWGAEDLSAAIGARSTRDDAGNYTDVFRFARTMTLLAASAAEVAAIDTVFVNFRDADALRARVPRGRARWLHRQAGDPPGAGGDHQRGVHAVAENRSSRRVASSPPSRLPAIRVSSPSTARCTTCRT